MRKLVLILALLVSPAVAQTGQKDLTLAGTLNQIRSGAILTVANGGTFVAASGGIVDLSLATLTLPAQYAIPALAGQSGKRLGNNGSALTWESAGSGSGDLLATNNLSDVANTATAFGNLVAGLSSAGLLTRTSAGAAAQRTLTGTANQITVTNGDGSSGNPTVSLPSALIGVNSITASSGNVTIQGASSGATVRVDDITSGSVTITNTGTGLVNINSSASATQARLNINLLSSGVAFSKEAVVSYQAFDAAGNFLQAGAGGVTWVDAAAGGWSQFFIHANDYSGGGSVNNFRLSSAHGILFFATDELAAAELWPGPNILKVYGTVDAVTGFTTAGNYTGTAATPVVAAVSTSASGQAQLQAASENGRLMTFGVFGDSKTGTTGGISNGALAYMMTGTSAGFYPSGLALGTAGGVAPIYFISGGSLVGTLGASSFNLAVPITNGTATTPSANDNDTSIATTAYVQTELTGYASDTVTFTNKSIALGSNTLTVPASSGTAIGRIIADPARADVFLVGNNFAGAAQDDTGKPSYYLSFDSRVAGDALKVFRVPAGGSATEALTVDATGTTAHGLLRAGTSPTTLTDAAGKILSASLNTVAVAQGGTGATTLTGYVKGAGTSAMTASATIPAADLTGLPDVWVIVCSDETTPLTTATAARTIAAPYAATVTAVRAVLTTAQASGSIFTVDINEAGASILSTKLTVDNTEKTSTSAATAAVISDSAIADGAELTVDIDQIGASGAAGLKVYIYVTRS